MDPFPTFPYFENPLDTLQTCFERTDAPCACCRIARGWVYTGNMYGHGTEDPRVCPWCIADGSASTWYPGAFNTIADGASAHALDMVENRTPNPNTWQDWRWPVCCGDGCVFKGQAQYERLTQQWPEAGKVLIAAYEEAGGWLGTSSASEFLEMFKNECDPAAYAFQCRACGTWKVEWDMS